MKKSEVFTVAIFAATTLLLAGSFDTGWKTWEQPNGATFTARYWGDEFIDWMETADGYRFVKGSDGYFCYAILNGRGEFIQSRKRVGIDPPLPSSHKLKRSRGRITQIQARIDSFNVQCDSAYQQYLSNRAASSGSGNTTYSLGVILVDFTPSERWRPGYFPDGYYKDFYDNLMFSRDYWVGPIGNEKHPEGHELFGSFADYYSDQSLSTVQFDGKDGLPQIVNPIDPADPEGKLPKWVVLPYSKSYYAYSVGLNTYFNAAQNAAESQLNVDLSQFDYLAFISAGPLMGGNIQGIASPSTGRYNMYEVALYVQPYFFSHIGSHTHEFGHLLGLGHKYGSSTYWNPNGIFLQRPRL